MSYRAPRLLALVITSLLCGELVPLSDKVFKATRVVEFTVGFEGTKRTRAVGKVLFPLDATAPIPELALSLTDGSPCLPLARKRKQLKVVAFFDEGGKQLVGVEQDLGQGTDLDPTYRALVEAVLEAKGWHDERMRAVEVDQLWLRPKRALVSDNAYLRQLAASFLRSHQADAIDAVWGAAGSEKRRINEAKATTPSGNLCAGRK